MVALSDYELNALREIELHKEALATRGSRKLLPTGARSAIELRGAQVAEQARKLPGFTKAADARTAEVFPIAQRTRP